MAIYKGECNTTRTKIYKHARMFAYMHSVSSLIYRQGFIQAILMAIIQYKKLYISIEF